MAEGFTDIVAQLRAIVVNLGQVAKAFSATYVSAAAANTFTAVQTFLKPSIVNAGSTGSGTIKPEGTISVQVSAAGVGNGADTTEDTLFTFSLPANSLDAIGRGLRFTSWGTLANNADSKTVRLRFGSSVYSLGTVTTANVAWRIFGVLYKTASNTQSGYFEGRIGATAIAGLIVTGAETDTLAITIRVTGQAGTGNANDIVANGLVVEYQN